MAASGSEKRATRAGETSTREHLLDVSLRAFAELGYDGASTRIIASPPQLSASPTGVSHSTSHSLL